ncbi:MAG: hypothetical protein WBQ08_01720 [Candidatus Sulfotelmatobacter sp.]
MSELVDASTWQYAVIAIRTQPRPERLVIAYPDEKTLHTVIAGPSIIALGYDSRDQAVVDIESCAPITVALRKRPGAVLVGTKEQSPKEIRAAKRRSIGRFGLVWTLSAIGHVLQHSVAAAIIFFYSKNILSATVRAFISF